MLSVSSGRAEKQLGAQIEEQGERSRNQKYFKYFSKRKQWEDGENLSKERRDGYSAREGEAG